MISVGDKIGDRERKTRTRPIFQEPTIQQFLRVVAKHGSSNVPELLLAAASRIDELEKCIGQMHDIIESKERKYSD